MTEPIKLTDEISYLAATTDPFTCDIIIIKPNAQNGIAINPNATWIFDVGCSKENRDFINSIPGPKVFVLSHFHPDHVLNLPFIKMTKDDKLFVSKYTKKYVLVGTVFDSDVKAMFSDKANANLPQIFELPSSHSKGCLCLKYGDYCFMGDGTYSKERKGNHTYNAQLLNAEIQILKGCEAKYFCLDHDSKFIYTKQELVELHESIYSRRKKDSPEISVEDFFNSDGSVKTPEQPDSENQQKPRKFRFF